MAFSWQESIKPAGTQDIQCDVEYLDKSYIHVYLDGEETTGYTWTSSTNIRLTSALTASTTVLLLRRTEREFLYIEFASGAPFIEANVDTQNTQFLHLAQELVEGRAIPGFYGTISMNGYRITNLGDPEDVEDAANKRYVDAGDARLDLRVDTEAAIRKLADDTERAERIAADLALDYRTSSLENTFISGVETVSYPWWTILTEATDTVTPGLAFTKAVVEVQGVGQLRGYSYEIVDNTILFADTLPAGTLVAARLGVDVTAGDGYATQAALDNLVASLGSLAYKSPGAAVTDATGTGDVVTQLNALLASLRAAGIIST
ncbi:tailspike adaptor protein [Klebsiella phage KPPK108.2]|nr:tailspike adaptor protein [Klebsiella phage KPPK108.2]